MMTWNDTIHGYQVRKRRSIDRMEPEPDFTQDEITILRLYFSNGMTYEKICARLRIARRVISSTIRKAIYCCPKLKTMRKKDENT